MVALAILAALAGLAGCDQDKVLYSGRNYLMFSDTLYHYAVQESNEKFEVPVSAMKKRFLYIALIALTLGCLYGTGYRRTAVHPHRRGDGSPASRRCQLG